MRRQVAKQKYVFSLCVMIFALSLLSVCVAGLEDEELDCENNNDYFGCFSGYHCEDFVCVQNRDITTNDPLDGGLPATPTEDSDGGVDDSDDDASDDAYLDNITLGSLRPSRFLDVPTVTSSEVGLLLNQNSAEVPYSLNRLDESIDLNETYAGRMVPNCLLVDAFDTFYGSLPEELLWCSRAPYLRASNEVTGETAYVDRSREIEPRHVAIIPASAAEASGVRSQRRVVVDTENTVRVTQTQRLCGSVQCEDDTSLITVGEGSIHRTFGLSLIEDFNHLLVEIRTDAGTRLRLYRRQLGTYIWQPENISTEIFLSDYLNAIDITADGIIAYSTGTGTIYMKDYVENAAVVSASFENNTGYRYNAALTQSLVRESSSAFYMAIQTGRRIYRADKGRGDVDVIELPSSEPGDRILDIYEHPSDGTVWVLLSNDARVVQLSL